MVLVCFSLSLGITSLPSTLTCIFFTYFLLIWLNPHEPFHADMAFASGKAAVTRIQVRECRSYPASEQVPTQLVLFFHFVFSFQFNSEIIFAFRQITPHHEFVFSFSYFLVSKKPPHLPLTQVSMIRSFSVT